jgi:hypothetical protein
MKNIGEISMINRGRLCITAIFPMLFLLLIAVSAADVSKEETLHFIRNKLVRWNIKGILGIPGFPEYNQPIIELTYWRWHVSNERVTLTAKAREPLLKGKQEYYRWTLIVKFDLRKIRTVNWDDRRVRLYFERDDIIWMVNRYEVTGGNVKLSYTKDSYTEYDGDNVLEIRLLDMGDGRNLGEAFNDYVKNWGSRSTRRNSRSVSRERDPFDD